MSKEVINVRVKPTKNTVLAELSVFDQIKLIFSHFNNKDSEELEAARTVSLTELKEKAEFMNIIDKSIEKLDGHSSITILVDSKYLVYAEDMLNDKTGLGKYYDFKLVVPDIPLAIKHTFKIRIARKESRVNAKKV